MTPEELAGELAQGRVRPAYLLAGGEALLREDALGALRTALLSDAARDFNHDRLDGDAAGAGRVLDAVRTLPVMAEHRLVELREPEAKRSAKLGDALVEALAHLAGQDQVVLVVSAAKIDKRSRWVKAFADPAALVVCDPPRNARETGGFVRAEAKRQGVRLGRGAAEALVEAAGPQLLVLRREVEKLALLVGEGAAVEREHVVQSACVVAEEPIWDLTDAIGEGRTPDALGVLHRLLESGAPPPVVLGSLASHFRKLVRTSCGEPPRGHPFALRKLESQARRYTSRRLLACLRAIQEVDGVLKGRGGLPHDLALERLVLGLAG